jgi:AraC family transcriptional regulator
LAKIAVEHGAPQARLLAEGPGWAVSDVVCMAGPDHRPFEEQHSRFAVAVVVSGTFQYRCGSGRELMTPGSLLLGNAGECFECGHEHGTGDRCVSFSYSPEFLEDALGVSGSTFQIPRIPAIKALSPSIAQAASLLFGVDRVSPEELAIQLAAEAIPLASHASSRRMNPDPSSLARVTRAVRMLENQFEQSHSLASLAQIAKLSRFHFLRAFESLTGTTPHQYLLRLRLHRAALRLKKEHTKIVDIALGCGFGDISNFNRSFRAEFGVNPRQWRRIA